MNTFVLTAINSATQRNVMLPPVAMLCCHLRVKNVIYAEGVRGDAPSTLARRPCSKADFTGASRAREDWWQAYFSA